MAKYNDASSVDGYGNAHNIRMVAPIVVLLSSCILMLSACQTKAHLDQLNMPLKTPPGSRLLRHLRMEDDPWTDGTQESRWVYFSLTPPLLMPEGTPADVYETRDDDAGAIVSLSEVVELFEEAGVRLRHPQRAWICGWRNGASDIRYLVHCVEEEDGYFLHVSARLLPAERTMLGDDLPAMPLQLPTDSRLVLDDRYREWDGLVTRCWVYTAKTKPQMMPPGKEYVTVTQDLEGLRRIIRSLSQANIWVRKPLEAWTCTWDQQREPGKWEHFQVDLLQTEHDFYLRIHSVYLANVRLERPPAVDLN